MIDPKDWSMLIYFYFSGMNSLSRQFGSALLNLGLKAGDKVAVLAPNCPEVSATMIINHFNY